ncbi:MAG: hypothetical protein Q8R37_05675, partial [Nanoarchaeota archaeon]|nr:hypothetical protein [Nanoarchaeota archaeon]
MNKKKKINRFVGLSLLLLAVFALIVYAASIQLSPSACNGQWSSCTRAFTNNAERATFTAGDTTNGTGVWKTYGFYPTYIKDSAIITDVTVRADFYASTTKGFIDVKVSGDGGVTHGSSHVVGGNTAEQTFNINVTNDLAWTPSMFSNNNFRVNATCFKS